MDIRTTIAAALCATVSSQAFAAAQALPRAETLDDIAYWVGSGTNRCAVVIDFNDDSASYCSFAWGYRWNGDAPSMKAILDEITASDPRLKMFASSSEYGSFIDAFAYDVDGDGGTFERVRNNDTYAYDHVKSDDDDLFPDLESTSYIDEQTENYVYEGTSWMLLFGTGEAFADVAFAETPNGADSTNPQNGEWYCWRICAYESVSDSNWNFVSYYCDTSSSCTPVVAPYVFCMDNIRFWVGSGTNKCAVVVDFNDGETGDRSFAWGFRWNGAAPSVKDILDEITASDPRLKMFASSSEYGSFIDAFAYDVDGDGGTFERVRNNDTYAYDHVKSDDDDLFPDLESTSYIDEQTGNHVYTGTSWMLLSGTGESFEEIDFTEASTGADLTTPENGEWICWRICAYSSVSDSNWNFVSYDCDIYSPYVAVAAYPSDAAAATLPTVGFSTFASLDAAFDAARGGGSVTLPTESSVNIETKTVTVGADETLQTYEVPAYFDMAVAGSAVSLKLNAEAKPTLATAEPGEELPFTVGDTAVTVVPGNVKDGLYYGLAVSTNLTAGFSAPAKWVRAENGKVVLQKEKDAAANGEFYKVCVSDIDESAKQ